jgi:hypothetical protein
MNKLAYPETFVDGDGVIRAAADLLDSHTGNRGNLKRKMKFILERRNKQDRKLSKKDQFILNSLRNCFLKF